MENKGFYDQKYFNWQKKVGEFGGIANQFKFKNYINKNDNIIDFGCGGGFLLKKIEAHEKLGIEINEHARRLARKNGIKVVSSIQEVENEWADVIISNHALEHVHNPLETLKELSSKLKKNGKIVFVVPQERKGKFTDNDKNNHLYTWTPLSFGNLFKAAGFKIIKAQVIYHLWPPYYYQIQKIFGWNIFHLTCKIYNFFIRKAMQVRVVAEKYD